MYNRRLFLSMSGGMLAAAALPAKLFASGPGSNAITPQSLGHYTQGTMTKELFDGLQGSVFTAFLSSGVAYLRLASVKAFGDESAASSTGVASLRSGATRVGRKVGVPATPVKVQGFTLKFAVSGALSEQGTYLLDHSRIGRLALFLVPDQGSATATVVTQTASVILPLAPIAEPVRARAGAISTRLSTSPIQQ